MNTRLIILSLVFYFASCNTTKDIKGPHYELELYHINFYAESLLPASIEQVISIVDEHQGPKEFTRLDSINVKSSHKEIAFVNIDDIEIINNLKPIFEIGDTDVISSVDYIDVHLVLRLKKEGEIVKLVAFDSHGGRSFDEKVIYEPRQDIVELLEKTYNFIAFFK